VFIEPKACWQPIDLSERRTAIEFAEEMEKLVDVHYPEAEKKITVVLDNLNTHTLSAHYEAFEPQEARRIARKVEFHYTPKRASGLNQAEVEISMLSGRVWGERIPDEGTLKRELGAWERERHEKGATVEWRFRHRLKPSLVMIEAEQRTAQEQERFVDLLASLITDRQPPILRYPRQRPPHYPPVPPQLLAALYLLPGYAALDAALLERTSSPPDAHSQALSAPSRLNGDTTAIDCHNCQIDCQAQREQKGVRRSGGEAYGRARDRIGPVSGASSEI
jgi:hypothetical protein